ncbi:hypothetical protein AB0C19_20520 [Micromonospora sp. NPDC048842]|uniref:hypothetical protein n=1 Tax=Micromonospora sp. NPDC048842 TaxID=3154346 RepID=UPI0033EF6E8C
MDLPQVANPYLEPALLDDPDFINQADNMRPAIENFLRRHDLVDVIRRMLVDSAMIRSIADASYAHVNGFEKLVVMRGVAESNQVRLNVWLPGRARINEDIHNHVKGFSSVVLCGRLRLRHFEIVNEGSPIGSYLARPPSQNDGDLLEKQATVSVEERFSADLPAGAHYSIDHRQLHTVRAAADELTATLVFMTSNRQQGPHVLRQGPDRQTIPRTCFSEVDVRDRLEMVFSSLAGS